MDLRVAPQAEQDPTAPQGTEEARSAGEAAPDAGQPFALLGFERRRVTRPNTRIVGAPGQILLSGEAREATRGLVETVPARAPADGSKGVSAPAFVLRGLR